MGKHGRQITLVCGVIAYLALAAQAGAAAGGYLTFNGCVGLYSSSWCASDPPDDAHAMTNAQQIVVTPDGKNAYVFAPGLAYGPQDSITHLHRGIDGQLSYADCLGDGGFADCPPPTSAGNPIGNVEGAAISPDGRDLYAGSAGDDISHFTVQPDGSLAYEGCVGDTEDSACASTPAGKTLDGISHIVISPDGKDAYAVSHDQLFHLRREGDGSLSLADCFGDEACAYVPDVLNEINGVAISPDGNNVYVSFGNSTGGVAHFRRRADGSLSFADCAGTAAGCNGPDSAVVWLAGAESLAMAPSGHDLYVSSESDSTPQIDEVTHLIVQPDGSLKFADCIGDGPTGCTVLPAGASLKYPRSLAIAPDGKTLYVNAVGTDLIARLLIGPDGELSYGSCAGGPVTCDTAYVGDSLADGLATYGAGESLYSAGSVGVDSFQLSATEPAPVGNAPTVSTEPATNVDISSAQISAAFDPNGQRLYGMEFQYGETTSYGSETEASESSRPPYQLSAGLFNLRPDTTYHYRIVARTPGGLAVGQDRSFTTSPASAGEAPQAQTDVPLRVGATSARVVGTVAAGGAPATYQFEWGKTTSYGHASPQSPGSAGDDEVKRHYAGTFTGLEPGTIYHYRVVATNATGTDYGSDMETLTAVAQSSATAPVANTLEATPVSGGVDLRALINPEGTPVKYHFEWSVGPTWYGTPTATPEQDAGAGDADEVVNHTVTGLDPGTTIHYRLVADAERTTVWAEDLTATAGTQPEPEPEPAPASPPHSTSELTPEPAPPALADVPRPRFRPAVAHLHVRHGRVLYTDRDDARVWFTLKRVSKRCPAGRRCRVVMRVVTQFHHRDRPGRNVVRLHGRLAVGSYELIARPSAHGVVGSRVVVRFTVAHGTRR